MVFGRRELWVIARFQLGRAAAGEALQAIGVDINPGILLYMPLNKV